MQMIADPQRELVRSLFEKYGVRGDIHQIVPRSADEVIFVVSSKGAANMKERELVQALTQLLSCKVWITTDRPKYRGRTELI